MKRAAQSGLTLLETLVMIAITALVAALLANVAERTNRANFARSDAIVASSALMVAEEELRRAGTHASLGVDGAQVSGDDRRFAVETIGLAPCGLSRNDTFFLIENQRSGGALVRVCGAGGPRRALLEWPPGVRATFSYSADGAVWTQNVDALSSDERTRSASFARLDLAGLGAPDAALVIRIGGARDDGRADGPTPPSGAP
jgi:type II secretory pathway pseudopilin PulG